MTTLDTIVMWLPENATQAVKVLNPEIPLAKYTFSYDPVTFKAVATTPSMTLTSMSLTSDFYAEELVALQAWYANSEVMKKYAAGNTRTPEQTEARFKQLADRWTAGFPYSGLMARNADGELVAMFNVGYAVDKDGNVLPGATEFAGVVNPEYWNQGLASEAMILMMVATKYISDNGYEIADAPLHTLSAPVREDNYGDNVLNNSPMILKFREERYGAQRNIYEGSVAEIQELFANTERSQQENGTFLPAPPRSRL